MDQRDQNGAGWQDSGVTEMDISVTVMEESASTLTVATIVGVTSVVILAIVIVFLLGVLLDCRQQKILANKMSEVKQARSQRRASAHPDGDAVTIVDNMEEAELSVAPVEALRTIP